jgi:general secretion pathway protein G
VHRYRYRRSAFTLVEIMVVVIIIGVLAALIVPALFSRVGMAKSATATAKIAVLENAINLFATEYDRYPEDLGELVERPQDVSDDVWSPPTVKRKDLNDPWGRPFVYRYPGEHWAFDLSSYGKDGTPGGDGEDADITNWE